jgi:hypothetical protein
MTEWVRTFYSVRTMTRVKSPNQDPYWAESGSGPGGRTLEEAHNRVRKDMERIGHRDLDKVKFNIVRTVETEEIVEEISGNHASFFMLKG